MSPYMRAESDLLRVEEFPVFVSIKLNSIVSQRQPRGGLYECVWPRSLGLSLLVPEAIPVRGRLV